jgi:hypothetical protein
MLQGLVTRDMITRTSAQTRGYAVRYGPGSDFPTAKKPAPRKSRPAATGADGDPLF